MVTLTWLRSGFVGLRVQLAAAHSRAPHRTWIWDLTYTRVSLKKDWSAFVTFTDTDETPKFRKV